MRHEEFMSHVVRYGGFSHDLEAESTVRVVLGVLRCAIPDIDADELARELPHGLADIIHSRRYEGPLELEALRERVCSLEGVRAQFAVAHLVAVVRALRDALSVATVERLRRHLPVELELEFDEPPASLPPPRSWRGAPSSPGGADITPMSAARVTERPPSGRGFAEPPSARGAWSPKPPAAR